MAILNISEVFGNDTALPTTEEQRRSKWCPFRESACAKGGKTDPLGICSYSDGTSATVVCPVRFLEQGKLIRDAGREAFGPGKSVVALPEFRLLEVKDANGKSTKIGKVDFIIGLLGPDGSAVDFAALEVQAVYVSGKESRTGFREYQRTGMLSNETKRRPDFRSSAQKRLMPQLSLKVPVFRRWAKRFFIAVDSTLFATLPRMQSRRVTEAEVTWLIYPFAHRNSAGYSMGDPTVVHTHWDDVQSALREGEAPEPEQLLTALTKCATKQHHLTT